MISFKLNLRDLEYLVAIADLRHFRKAAERCFVSQPTLSGQVKKLEGSLGLKLIERTKTRVFLTQAGKDIVSQARLVLQDAERLGQMAESLKDPFIGPLKLGAFPTLGPYLFPHIVPKIQNACPKLSLFLVEEQTHRLLPMLKSGEIEAAILALPEEHEDLVSTLLFKEPFYLAVHKKNNFARRKSIKQEDLQGESLLLLQDGHCLRTHALEVCRYSGALEHSGFRATSLETLRQMVAMNVGITLMPELAVQKDISGHNLIRYIPFSDPIPDRSIGLLYRETSPRQASLKVIAKIISQQVRSVVHPTKEIQARQYA